MIICEQECEFGVILKDDYVELLASNDRKKIYSKLAFIKECMFPNLDFDLIKTRIFFSIKKIKFRKN